MFQNISSETFYRLSEEPDSVIIDVRTLGEAQTGIIPGAILLDIFHPEFARKVQALDKSKKYLIYCRSGNRSAHACMMMAQMGFEHTYNLAQGMYGWRGPVVGLPEHNR